MYSYLLGDLGFVKCQKMVQKKLPYREHSKRIACYKDPSSANCTEPCDQPMSCCSKKCKGKCGGCRKLDLDVKKVQSGLITLVNHTLASERRISSIFAGNHATPRTKGATTSASNPAASVIFTTRVPTVVLSPTHCVWKDVHGGVDIMNVQ